MSNTKKIMSLCLAVIIALLAAGTSMAEGQITGYFYDPVAGKLLPQYDNLGPKESETYLKSSSTSTSTSNTNVSETSTSSALTEEQVQAINPAKISISSLTISQREWLTQRQIKKVNYQDFQYLPVSKIPLLSRRHIESIPNSSWFKKFSGEQIKALTKTQVKAIKSSYYSEIRSLLTPEQIIWREGKKNTRKK